MRMMKAPARPPAACPSSCSEHIASLQGHSLPPLRYPQPLQDGETCLHIAAHYGRLGRIDKLIAMGAEIDPMNHAVFLPP